MRKIRHVSASRLRELFTYDPITGAVRRLTTGNAGKIAGTKFSTGHLQVSVDGKMTGVHRIAWALHNGEYPSLEIDHINGDGADNRLCNLRLATSSQNNQNRRMSSRNKSGVKGVFLVKWAKGQRWRVSVGHSRGKYYITHFQCFGQAIKHAAEMRAKLHDQFARAS
jgi:hypothetical protein